MRTSCWAQSRPRSAGTGSPGARYTTPRASNIGMLTALFASAPACMRG